MVNYGPTSDGLLRPLLHTWLENEGVSEIMMNRPQEIYVEQHGKMTRWPVPDFDERLCETVFQLVANENQQKMGALQPLLSGSLLDGSRIQLVIPPTAQHPTFAIRRQVVQNWSLDHYADSPFYDHATPFTLDQAQFETLPSSEQELVRVYAQHHWDAFIRLAIEQRKNIVISGGTSSGKTTYLNACLRHMPQEDRLITLEDTREINTPHPNQVNLLASKGEQGLAQVTMQDLVQCCLRLRPDRIIMGEIRGAEIRDFVSACSTGHEGSITSIHANNPHMAFMRMVQMYKLNPVPSMSDEDILRELKAVVDIMVQLNKMPSGRRVHSLYYRYGHLANVVSS